MLDILIRLHENADLDLFKDAINSIKSQSYQKYNVCVLGQSLSQTKIEQINTILISTKSFKIHNFNLSSGDHRSFLLNQGFDNSQADFIAILDYDDLVYKNSYQALITDLVQSNADISFGGVRKNIFDTLQKKSLSKNDQAFYGPGTYYHFLNRPFFPIHSYVINLKSIRNKNITLPKFPETLSYLEDSCFLAELFPKVVSSFSCYKNIFFEYRFRTDGSSYVSSRTKEQTEKWNTSQDYFYALAKNLKKQNQDIVFYKNNNILTKFKSNVVGLLNRKSKFRSIRDLLKKLI